MGDGYSIEIETSAAKSLLRLQRHDQARISKAINTLATNPRPAGCIKLSGTDALYRIRVGNYRVIYSVDDTVLVVAVTKIGHRREIYR